MNLSKKRYKDKLCGMCNNPAVGYGRISPGNAHCYVCKKHKEKVVEFKPFI